MTGLETLTRRVLEAYSAGDPEPLIDTFGEDVSYEIVHLDEDGRLIRQWAFRSAAGADE